MSNPQDPYANAQPQWGGYNPPVPPDAPSPGMPQPYGQPHYGQAYGQPYGQPQQPQPYGQPQYGQPQPQSYGQPMPYGQPQYGQPYGQPVMMVPVMAGASDKSRTVLIILSVLFGSLGVDRFYAGNIVLGLLKFFTFGGLGIWWLIDIIVAAAGGMRDNYGRPIVNG